MAHLREKTLEINLAVIERRLRFRGSLIELRPEFLGAVDDPHAASAAAAARFQKLGITDCAGSRFRRIGRGESAFGTGHDRNADRGGGLPGGNLVAHLGDAFAVWPDEIQIVFRA